MSAYEWTIVTSVAAFLILLFVALEILFPMPEPSEQDRSARSSREPKVMP